MYSCSRVRVSCPANDQERNRFDCCRQANSAGNDFFFTYIHLGIRRLLQKCLTSWKCSLSEWWSQLAWPAPVRFRYQTRRSEPATFDCIWMPSSSVTRWQFRSNFTFHPMTQLIAIRAFRLLQSRAKEGSSVWPTIAIWSSFPVSSYLFISFLFILWHQRKKKKLFLTVRRPTNYAVSFGEKDVG